MAWNNENNKRRFSISARCLLAGFYFWQPESVFATECAEWVAKAISLQGTVEVRNDAESSWQPVIPDQTFCGAETIRVLEFGRAVIQLRQDATNFQLGGNSALTLPPPAAESPRWLELIQGAAHFLSRTPSTLKINAPFVNAHIEGTEFLVRTDPKQTEVLVFAGRVSAENPLGQVSLAAGEKAVASADQAPRKYLLVRPRDAVEWAVYYPPVIDLREAERTWRTELRPAIGHIRQGDLSAALEQLEHITESSRDAQYQVLRAAALLNSGRVDETEKTLGLLPPEGEWAATADAMRSVIALARNDKPAALQLARRATQRPNSSQSAPYVALSYAEQGRFDIARALEAAQQAVGVAPQNGLAWARVAELALESGQRSQALEAAHKAAALDPQLARVQALLGFAALSNADYRLAEGRFDIAIRLDPADPLPRLGKGLAQIRGGHLDEGTRSLAVAAILDPDRSLTRSYLGKAYYEKNKSIWAQQEFETAKQLDPQDPTPWLYSALSLQAGNRPVEALRNMQQSVERNDNRAVYRSRLLLDDDRASRNTSLGRIYTDLGIQQPAVVQATKSLASDPANSSAHRLISDTFNGLPRTELARASSLLQARLLQPISSNPIRPSRSGSDLTIVPGNGFLDAGYNEFSPLFERNRLRFLGTLYGGSHGTIGDEAVLSGITDRLAVSLGQFHSMSNGFRPNSDLRQDIYEGFVQMAATPTLDLQAQFNHQFRDGGDLRMQVGRKDPGVIERQSLSRGSGRLGAHLKLGQRSDLILSYLAGNKRENGRLRNTFDQRVRLWLQDWKIVQDSFDSQFDGQYLYGGDRLDMVLGLGIYDSAVNNSVTNTNTYINSDGSVTNFDPLVLSDTYFSRKHESMYLYSYIHWPGRLVWTIGAAYDHATERDGVLSSDWSRKFGLQWDVVSRLQLRFAYIETVRPVVSFDQVLQPPQVAGFNQYFDDAVGAKSRRFGVGIDGNIGGHTYYGAEASRRDVDTPYYEDGPRTYERFGAHEIDYRAYISVLPYDRISLAADYRFDRYVLDDFSVSLNQRINLRDQHVISLVGRYFNENGLFVELGGRWIDQDIFLSGEDQVRANSFLVADLGIGFRFPNRHGMFTVRVNNFMDQRFNYEDDTFRVQKTLVSNEASHVPDLQARSPVFPVRTFFAGLTLAW